jgi:hypothetical protein
MKRFDVVKGSIQEQDDHNPHLVGEIAGVRQQVLACDDDVLVDYVRSSYTQSRDQQDLRPVYEPGATEAHIEQCTKYKIQNSDHPDVDN